MTGYRDLRGIIESERALGAVLVIEDDSDGSFDDTCLATDRILART